MMRSTVPILMLICLTSCSTVNTSYIPIGVPVKSYTKAQQVQAANELKSCVTCTEVKEMLKDGYTLRQANRELVKTK